MWQAERIKQNARQLMNFYSKHQLEVLVFSLSVAVFLCWLIGFFPAVMTTDSITHWKQAGTLEIDNASPFFFTFLLVVVRNIWDSPALLSIIQILISSSLVTYAAWMLKKHGVKQKWIALGAFLFVVQPSIGIYNITIWKDVLYTQLIMLLVLLTMHILLAKKSSRFLKYAWIWIGLTLPLIASLRHNGIIYLALVPLVLVLFRTVNLKYAAKLVGLAIAVYIGIQFGLGNALGVYKDGASYDTYFREFPYLQLTGAIISNNRELTDYERGVIEQFAPIDQIQKYYRCRSARWLYELDDEASVNVSRMYDADYRKEFNTVALRLFMRNIPVIVGDRACMFGYTVGLKPGETLLYSAGLKENDLGIEQIESNLFSRWGDRYLRVSSQTPLVLVFWTLALPLLINLGYMLKSVYDHNKRTFIYTSIVLINAGFLFFVNISDNYRYLFILEYSVFFLPLFDMIKSKREVK